MGDVRILPEILSNKIAAGEVVERPVSVLKELMENSLDAGATAITVEIERGGRDLVRVSDNGRGMGRDDAILSIERYATSKIFTDDDLFSIHTFGFRGEALPSIASVSDFVLTTRRRDADSGTRVHIRGGKFVDVTDIGAPPGTMVEVKNLYFNTPARRKFLKSINTEMGHIADTFSGMALGNPSIGFRLFHNDRPVKRFSFQDDPLTRAGEVLGRQLAGHLCRVALTSGKVDISGFVADPDLTQTTPGKSRLFVNNRMISDRGILSAVFRGFHGRIMKGRFPIAFLFINLPVDQVDVNVHPSKLHVRFADSRGVYGAVARAVQDALNAWQKQHYQGLSTPGADDESPTTLRPEKWSNHRPDALSDPYSEEEPSRPDRPIISKNKDRPRIKESLFQWGTPEVPEMQVDPPEKDGAAAPEPVKKIAAETIRAVAVPSGQPPQRAAPQRAAPTISIIPEMEKPEMENDDPAQAPSPLRGTRPVKSSFTGGSTRVIGQLLGLYILLESQDGMVLLDQHAAHERIVYERLKKRSALFNPPSQTLVVPETLELDFREAALLEAILPELATLGMDLEPFGENSFLIKSVPALIDDRDIRPLIRDMLDGITASNIDTGDEGQKQAWLDECLKLMACHHAIRGGKKMNSAEMAALVRELESCENPYHCPHGRPTRIEWSGQTLQKMFKRIL